MVRYHQIFPAGRGHPLRFVAPCPRFCDHVGEKELEDKRSDNELEHGDRTCRCSRSAGLLSSFWRHPRGQSVGKQFVDDRRPGQKFAGIYCRARPAKFVSQL